MSRIDFKKMIDIYDKNLNHYMKISREKKDKELYKLVTSKKYKTDSFKYKLDKLYNLFNKVNNQQISTRDMNKIKLYIGAKHIHTSLKKVNEYTVIKELGKGLYGSVSLVTKNGKQYAIKVENSLQQPYQLTILEYCIKIKNEYNLLIETSKLKLSPKVYDIIFYYDKTKNMMESFIIMDYIDSIPLQIYIKNKELTENDIKALNRMIIKLHKHNIYHTDIHSENILVNLKNKKYSKFILIDFGRSVDVSTIKQSHQKHNTNYFRNMISNGYTNIDSLLAINKIMSDKKINIII
jgi:serine/threonine protein kinase